MDTTPPPGRGHRPAQLAPARFRALAAIGAGPNGEPYHDVEGECAHGRLAGDRSPACGCYPSENPASAAVIALGNILTAAYGNAA